MEAANLSPTPPDKILAIALSVVAIFAAAEIAGTAIYYINRARTEYVAAHPKAAPAPVEAPKTTAAPVEETTPAMSTVLAPPSATVLSAAERLLKEATELRDKGDTTNALARLQEAAQSDPKNANVLAQMAMIYESIQLFDRSNETWRKIQELGPSAGAMYELADIKLKSGVTAPATAATGPGLAGVAPLDAGNTRSDDGITEGSTFGITAVTATDTPDADSETHMQLKIAVTSRPNTPVDHTKVKIQVFFYDIVNNKDIVLTDAEVSYEWLTPNHDWKVTNSEILAVTYTRPKNQAISPETALATAAAAVTPSASGRNKNSSKKTDPPIQLPDRDGPHKYLGYIIRIYYKEQLQASRADPSRLLNQFPPPLTLSSP